jgi:glycerate 2-kinase
MTPRALLLNCFRAALAAVDGRRAVQREFSLRPLRGDWHLVAIGNAAGAMAPHGHVPPGFDAAAHRLAVHYAAHPVPDASSLAAGAAAMDYVARLPKDAQILCLVSGGASSLVESLAPGVGLDDLQALNHWALQAGASIVEINAARRKLSRLKGGGLARLGGERRMHALMISDVPGDDPRVIGSGLLHGAGASSADAIPDVPVRVVASIGVACRAAAAAARAAGFKSRVVRARLAGDAEEMGMKIVRSLARQPGGVLQVRGGETTVRLPPATGRGGRNQHLALAAAIEMERRDLQGAHLLAAGTDGIDGATDDAGAIVDAYTCVRIRDAGYDLRESLERADSGTVLEAAGDLLHIGPTGTNVGDLVLALGS